MENSSNLNSILPSSEEMRALDSACINSGTSSLELMERAGQRISEKIQSLGSFKQIVILCGPGNNGGDGLVIARHLSKICKVVVIIANSNKYSHEFLDNYKKLADSIEQYCFDVDKLLPNCKIINTHELSLRLEKSCCILDALLGTAFSTGQQSAPRENISKILDTVATSSSSAVKISVDIPTGINASTGEVFKPAFKADYTICVAFIKRGLLQAPACDYTGTISVVDIGIPAGKCRCKLLEAKDFPKIKRLKSSHKASSPPVYVIGSSAGMAGASALSALSALRVGVGLVTRIIPSKLIEEVAIAPEIMHKRVGDKDFFDLDALNECLELTKNAGAIVIGPGLGSNVETLNFVTQFLEQVQCPCVIDADALRVITKKSTLKFRSDWVITPHPGELSRMLEVSLDSIKKDRFTALEAIISFFPGPVVLKGYGSLVGVKEQIFLNTTGNSAMASAGMGDALSGIIAGLIAQKLSPLSATLAGVFLHGRASDLVFAKRQAPVIASDVIEALPWAMGEGFFEVCR